jgi:anthranilate synthase component 2
MSKRELKKNHVLSYSENINAHLHLINSKTVVLLDNYDSFTYNILQYLGELGAKVLAFKNDEISLDELKKINFSHLVISPGPGNPTFAKDFGVCSDAIKYFFDKKPILGVCLGHQGIVALYGGSVKKASEIMHGVRSTLVKSAPSCLFENVEDEFEVMRYHSLIVEDDRFPDIFRVTARTKDKGLIMAFEHKNLPVFGVQFHPESIGTLHGKLILENFLNSV